MSMTLSTIISAKTWRNYSYPPLKISTTTLPNPQTRRSIQFQPYLPKKLNQRLRFSGAKLGFCIRAENVGGGEKETKRSSEEDEEDELRGQSTMPDRFRYLAKEVPSPPILWPWFIVLGFLIYTWKVVLWELSNWKKLIIRLFGFLGGLPEVILAIIHHFLGDPVLYTILYFETTLDIIRDFCVSVVTSAPIPELTTILILATIVLAIGETASPNSINSQPHTLTVAGIIGFGAVKGVIIEPFFWFLLFGIFTFSRVFKRRDNVSSALPVATVLASVGEPWIRVLAIFLFAALAIHHHSKKQADEEEGKVTASSVEVPFPLLGVALAIGIRAAFNWAGYRHLTWMIRW